jgi:NADH-quinone oxidoreductase subunit L
MMMLLQVAVEAHPWAGSIAEWVWLLPVLPLLGFVINGALSVVGSAHVGPKDPDLGGHADESNGALSHAGTAGVHGDDTHAVKRHKYEPVVSIVGPAVLALSFILAWMIFSKMRAVPMEEPFVQRYFSWIPAGNLQIDASLQLDHLSMLMVLVVTGVGTLIHIFSVGYMRDDPGYPRYFAYLNLFVFFMLVLVLGASYPVMFVGWEGVGLCSYLLIGFWFSDKANADAGKKAFIVNRIGDFGFLIAMFLLFVNFGALDFAGVNFAAAGLPVGSALLTTICLFLFLGCVGKSAQIPLYVWLPDAMAGPTPVSALIHAATMVTAGVYLVARSAILFSHAPVASLVVALVGAVTAIFAATIGLKQWDIKKVLAYSTVSQLGYMFIGVGVGAYTAGLFHLVTHAFFKALLFLGAGSVIYAIHAAYHHTHNEDDAQDMRNMGGLRSYMPFTWVLMWIATLAIAGIPFFAGFFSKDEILGSAFTHAQHSTLANATLFGIPGSVILYFVYILGLAAAFLTAIYMSRMMIYTFHGPNRTGEAERKHLAEAPWVMTGPLLVLGVLSAFGGWLNVPELLHGLGPVGLLEHWLDPVVGASERLVVSPAAEAGHAAGSELALIGIAVLVAVAGIAYAAFRLKPQGLVPKAEAPDEEGFGLVLANKYYVDEAYDDVIVNPTYQISKYVLWKGIDSAIIDGLFVNGSSAVVRAFGWLGSRVQTGALGTYAWVLVAGVLVVLGAVTLR